ncbi:MAG TPA: CBS domain-containing protein [Nitrospiraceae bacterium]|nr:CBS domain-containing protein [Nitrospiraceae bacterium]
MSFELNLDSETVDQVSTSIPLIAGPGFVLRDVLRMMKDQRKGAVLVCENDLLVGIFTERDALKLLAAGANLDVPVREVMTANPESLSDQDTVATAILKMSRGGYRRMPVVDGEGRPKGFVKVATILHYLVEHFPSVVYTLPPQPHYTTETREGA